MAQCKDCRYYERLKCSGRNTGTGPTNSSCYYFSAYSGRSESELKYCKDCRFFSAPSTCVERNSGTSPTSSKCVYGSIVK